MSRPEQIMAAAKAVVDAEAALASAKARFDALIANGHSLAGPVAAEPAAEPKAIEVGKRAKFHANGKKVRTYAEPAVVAVLDKYAPAAMTTAQVLSRLGSAYRYNPVRNALIRLAEQGLIASPETNKFRALAPKAAP